MYFKAFQQRGQVLELSLTDGEAEARSGNLCPGPTNYLSLVRAWPWKENFRFLFQWPSCQAVHLAGKHLDTFCMSVWEVSVPLWCLDLLIWTSFFHKCLSETNKKPKANLWRFSSIIHNFCSARWFPVPVCALGFFFFSRCLLLINILIDTVDKCKKTSLHYRNSHCLRLV